MQLESPNENEDMSKELSTSESDLLKLKKINFKKKVSGKWNFYFFKSQKK